MLIDFHWDEAKNFFFEKKIKMADSKKQCFSKSPILITFHGLVLGLVEIIDAKGIDVA